MTAMLEKGVVRGAANHWVMRHLHTLATVTTSQAETETPSEETRPGTAFDAARAADQARYYSRQRRFAVVDKVLRSLLTPQYHYLTGLIYFVVTATFFLTRTGPLVGRILQAVFLNLAWIVLVCLFPVLQSQRRVPLHPGLWNRYQRWKARTFGITDADWPDPRRRRSPHSKRHRKKRR